MPRSRRTGATSQSSRLLARILDDAVRIPGTRFGIGLDALIGLIPGFGDAAGAIISSIILGDAVRNRVPLPVLARMGLNLIIDALLGLIPGVGDVADAAHRANLKNVRLLERTLEAGRTTSVPLPLYLAQAVGFVVLIIGMVIALAVVAIWALLRVLGLGS
ncbi:MAG: DUF4112 domain-containing protein [Mobilicoccus sp.]|nr:DUF4112 domain-containing protein [Mobilicoccus sp.]